MVQKRFLLGLALLCSVLVLFLACAAPAESIQPDFGLAGGILTQFTFDGPVRGVDSTMMMGRQGGSILRILKYGGWSAEMAENYVFDKNFMVRSLYRNVASPYPGQLSNTIECAEEFKPSEGGDDPFGYFTLYATERLTYGACSWDLIRYRAALLFTYCNSTESFYQIELFVPLDDYSPSSLDSLRTIGCTEDEQH